MTNVSFNEEPVSSASIVSAKKPLLVGMILATGVVRTQKQAEYVLIGIVVLALLTTLVMWPKGRPAPELDVTPIAAPSEMRQ